MIKPTNFVYVQMLHNISAATGLVSLNILLTNIVQTLRKLFQLLIRAQAYSELLRSGVRFDSALLATFASNNFCLTTYGFRNYSAEQFLGKCSNSSTPL